MAPTAVTESVGTLPIVNRLLEKRGERSIREVCEQIGISPGGLSQLENGIIFPSRPTLERLCAYYGCDVGDLYTNSPKNIPEKV